MKKPRPPHISFDDELKEEMKDPRLRALHLKARERLQTAYAILEMRHKAKMTQKQLAKKMKVSQSLIARLEDGTQNPTMHTMYNLAAACGKNLVWKFG